MKNDKFSLISVERECFMQKLRGLEFEEKADTIFEELNKQEAEVHT